MADNNVQEKRWAKRIAINATIRLNSLNTDPAISDYDREEISVDVINISKGGMAFTTERLLPLESFYDAKVELWTRESFDAVIEVIRMEKKEADVPIIYGCRFVGLSPMEQFKIDVYDIVNEQ